ncbi:hypothetical protein B0H13DRAFT_1875474 [Mycena leptocephala]|nr:hypothetical protein B0H13DRAFT_1875474 [Mycena leptocephala]
MTSHNYLGPVLPELKDLTIVEEAMAILIGVLKSVARLNETDKILVLGLLKVEILGNVFGGQGKSLVYFLDVDCGCKPRVILIERTWAHNNTVMINMSAQTEMVNNICCNTLGADLMIRKKWRMGSRLTGTCTDRCSAPASGIRCVARW